MTRSQFTEIKRGDIYKTKDGVFYSWNLCSNGKDDTEAAVYHAELNITGSFGQKKFTVKTYHGRNAMKEWRRDFAQCSKDLLRDVPLFGFNKSAVPSLIFCGELVPLAHMEGRMGGVGLFYTELLRNSLGCARNELWMDPKQGRFCRGPIGPNCRFWRDGDFSVIVPSDVEFLKEDVIIRYLASKQEDWGLLYTLGYASHIEILHDIPSHTRVVSSLTNSMIAFMKNLRWRNHTDCLDKWREMPDGARRFNLTDDRRKIRVESFYESDSWLLQALSVFHTLNISFDEDLSSYKYVDPYIKLTGTLQKSKRKRQRRQSLFPPVYFIIRPSLNPVYHWSFDPTGQTPLLPEMCKYLGLPFKLSLKVTPFQFSWPTKVYEHIHDYQISRKFDPKTTDFAQAVGYPIFNVVAAENRFHEIVEGQHEVPAGVPSLAMVRDGSELVPESESNTYSDHVEDPEELDDSFSLDSLFYETEGSSNISSASDANPVQTGNAVQYTRRGRMNSILDTLFTPFTWEAIEGSGISAAAI
ncbi:hypothetical protein E1B28_011851 [Marasmius oreades]|uniref:Uncharacterized protein n=1 Tax=Marasmius oreades TaxID=181124 RepID=A0A9P7RV04_9AGAR|nr:uncharacterized protein E1B28_011851 [Marasmius oreades]KAG7090254.1 hypothetical protein E1B28_011851 [Marasmius oreades]